MKSVGRLGCASLLYILTATGAEKPLFPEVYNSQEETIPFLPASETVGRIKLPPGFAATVYAAEPEVQQPIGMNFDSRGRLWVAENYTYSESAINFHPHLRDRIVIFEDSDGDGRSDRRKVFWDRAQKLTSVLPAFGGVYALCPPQLLFLPDRDGDDSPDSAPEPLLDGFDHDKIRHTLANGLKLGPDGWIYGRQGIQGTSFVGRPGAAKEERTAVNGSIWRFHPVSKKFELVAQGTTNPWGHDWDQHGELFFINTVIGHLWHAIPGAWFKRMYGEPFNPYVYELIDQVADHVHWDTREAWNDINKGISSSTLEAGGGHAHSGLLIYQGDNWPAEYRHQMFTLNFHGKRINHDRLTREGAGYIGKHAPDFMSIDDPYFRGIDLVLGPDGGVYVADWSDIGECHDHNGVHRTSGRIYRIAHGQPAKSAPGDLARLSHDELVKLQFHPNEWVVRQARQVLQEKAIRGEAMTTIHGQLTARLKDSTITSEKLRALWALYVTGGTSNELLQSLLATADEHVRVWAIRLLVDQQAPSSEVIRQFSKMAKTDRSGLVLAYLASALQRIPAEQRWELGQALVSRGEFNQDKMLPLMVWYGIEAAVSQSPGKAAALVQGSKLHKVTALATRRVFEDLEENAEAADKLVQLLTAPAQGEGLAETLFAITEALEGQQKPAAPASWPKVAPRLLQNPDHRSRALALELDSLFGSATSRAELIGRLEDSGADAAARRRALEILVRIQAPGLPTVLERLLVQPQMAADAIRALAKVGPTNTPAILISHFKELNDSGRREVVNMLVSRPAYANALLSAVQRGQVDRKEIGATQMRQLRGIEDAGVEEKLARIWPQTDDSSLSKAGEFAKYKKLLSPEALKNADLARGREVYQKACAPCHKLYGEGAEIGPELTGSDRRNLDYLLENILNPSGVVPENYRVSIVNLRDDQVHNGMVVAQTDRAITLQTVSERLTIPREQVESIQESELSMMPDGLFTGLEERQVLELIAYLMSANPPSPSGGR